jgi:ribonuclease T2
MKNEALIRREWQTHGSCTGLSPGDYFTNIRLARSQVQIPVQVSSVDEPATETPARIKGQFAAANPGFPESAFRVACARGRLSEVRVCFDLLMKARACGASVPECTAPFFTTGPLR